jgi:two-component system chemotaxis sensor kinase CheA
MRTKRVSRQLKKVFGGDDVEEAMLSVGATDDATLAAELLTKIKGILEKFPEFLDSVEESYQQLEERLNLAQRSMELNSKELTDSNTRLFGLNRTLDAMVNSLGQGFVLFGPDGICKDVYSKASDELLETCVPGKQIADVLHVAHDKRAGFNGWLEILFQDTLDFTEFSKLGPRLFNHSEGKRITIDYAPVRNRNGQIELIVAIATDITKEFEANERAEHMKAQASFVTSILKNRDRFTRYLKFFRSMIEKSIHLASIGTMDSLLEIRRDLHTLKGASGSFGMLEVQMKIHGTELAISSCDNLASCFSLLQKNLPELKSIFEAALQENSEIMSLLPKSNDPIREVSLTKLAEFGKALSKGSHSRDDLYRTFVKDILSVPANSVFSRFDSVVQETAEKLGKRIKPIRTNKSDVRMVPEQYCELLLNLEHIFRNIADHGIEGPEERQNLGKDAEGTISVQIEFVPNNPNMAEVRISDDGRGIDEERVRKKLLAIGQVALSKDGSREEIWNAIFLPGLSTAQYVTEISGNGVGLHAVRTCLSEMGGEISVTCEPKKGTTFVIRLPLKQYNEFVSFDKAGKACG